MRRDKCYALTIVRASADDTFRCSLTRLIIEGTLFAWGKGDGKPRDTIYDQRSGPAGLRDRCRMVAVISVGTVSVTRAALRTTFFYPTDKRWRRRRLRCRTTLQLHESRRAKPCLSLRSTSRTNGSSRKRYRLKNSPSR